MNKSNYKEFKKGKTVISNTALVVYNKNVREILQRKSSSGKELSILATEVHYHIRNDKINYDPIGTRYTLDEDMYVASTLNNNKLVKINGIHYYAGFFTIPETIKKRRKLIFK